MLFLSIILTGLVPVAIMFFAIVWANKALTLAHRWWFRDANGDVVMPALWQAIGVSAGVGLISFAAPRLSGMWVWLAPVMLLALAAVFVNLFIWWGRRGSMPIEAVPMAIISLITTLVMGSAAAMTASLIPVALIATIIMALPWLAFIAYLGFLVAGTLIWHYRNGGRKRQFLVLGIIAAALFGLIFLGMLGRAVSSGIAGTDFGSWSWSEFWAGITGQKKDIIDSTPGSDLGNLEVPDPGPSTPTTADLKSQWHFRHDDVIADNYDANGNLLSGEELEKAMLNDYDFGHSVLNEAVAAALNSGKVKMEDIANKSERELFELVGVDPLVSLMVDAMADDPALGAAVMGYHDAMFGTREFLGDFFTQFEEEPDRFMKAMNGMKDYWVTDKQAYYAAVNHWVNIVYTAKDIRVEYVASGIDDQMYQHGAVTLAENATIIPDDIVMTSYDHSGYFITFVYVIKETKTLEISYRIDCGFQPCNVSEVLETTPAKNPNGSKPTPSNPGGKPAGGDPNGGKPAGGDPGQEEMSDPKDPTEGTDVPVNDVTGPGPDTNNGVGSQFSSVQEPTGSVFLPTYDDYKEAMKPVENNPARPAGTPNTPSYQPPKTPDAVDNNGDSGYGWGGADTPTTVQPPAEVDKPGYNPEAPKTEWGGPPL